MLDEVIMARRSSIKNHLQKAFCCSTETTEKVVYYILRKIFIVYLINHLLILSFNQVVLFSL